MTPSFSPNNPHFSRNDVPPHDFNLRTLLCIQLLTHETMSENIGFTDSKDSVHCKKDVPLRHFLTYMVMCVCKFCASFSWSASRLGPRGQSSCSVVLRGWCLYSMVVMHTYIDTRLGKTAVNVWTNVRRWVEHV